VEALGGLDIIVANAGWTRFSNFNDLHDLSHDEWNKCWATNVMSHLQLMQEAAPIFNANPDGGVYLISSSVAGISTGGSSMAYSVTKAAGLHLMRCLAVTQGPKIRVNAVLPGLLLTEWGLKYPQEAQQAIKERAALKHETKLDDCADAYIAAAKNSSQTGQKIVVDAGLII
jgi:NAD(P)-dependent dehydrogenase (short-subunit alcohol dehydrogenase family)